VRRWRLLRRRLVLRLSLARRAAAEGVGTAFLLAAIVGSGVMGERLASGNVAIALLANTLATASALVALIVMFADVSGAHFNPLVSVLSWLDGTLSVAELAAYMGAQFLGAGLGVMAAHVMFGLATFEVSTHARPGFAQGFAEAVATLGLLLVVGLGSRSRPAATPFAVAAYIAAAYWFTSSTSFANPAVTLARASTDTFAGIRPGDVPRFLLGQAAGAGVAVMMLRWWIAPRQAA
jgi:glycerol uptake facilitator-like aquaporin